MILELQKKTQMKSFDSKKIHAICLLVENSTFQSLDKPYYEKICGRAMHEYVENLCKDFKKTVLVLEEKQDVASCIKSSLDESEFTLILFSDTPLLTREIVEENIEKLIISGEKIVLMPRGFVAKTSFLKTQPKIENIPSNFFEKNEFFRVKNLADLESATRFMQNKILNYHINAGVKIIDKQTTKIDADVEIEKGCVIHPFSQILGKTRLKEGCEVNFSVLKSTFAQKNCKIECAYLELCRLDEGAYVNPFSSHIKEEIKK